MTDTYRRVRAIIFLFFIIYWVLYISFEIYKAHQLISTTPGAASTNVDTVAFWSAALFALNGEPLTAFDLDAMRALQANADVPGDYVLPWLYPPGLLVLLMPLGTLDFIGAWIALVVISIIALHVALRRLDASWGYINLLVLFSPATLICAVRGQLSMLFAAAVVLGLSELTRGSDRRAALWFALVTLKPQLCLAFPVALVAARRWRLMGMGILLTLALSVAPLPVVGFDYWAYWREAVDAQSNTFPQLAGFARHGLTWRTFFANLGAEESAPALQWMFGFATLGLMAAIWARRDCTLKLRGAALLFAMVGASPYALSYEALFPLLGALLLVQATWTPEGQPRSASWGPKVSALIFIALLIAPHALFFGIAISSFVMPLSLAGLVCALSIQRGAAVDAAKPGAVAASPSDAGPA